AAELFNRLVSERARRAIGASRALRRIQPPLRPRHRVWSQDRRQCRIDSLVNAAGGEMAMIDICPLVSTHEVPGLWIILRLGERAVAASILNCRPIIGV